MSANAEPAPVPTAVGRWARTWRWLSFALRFGLPPIIVWAVWREFRHLDLQSAREQVASADLRLAALGIGAAFGAVVAMGLYDAVAFPRGEHGRLGFGRRWLLGSVLFGWTNFVSLGPIGGPALRVLAYRRFGLNGAEITRGFVGHGIGSASGLLAWMVAVWTPGLGPVWARAAVALVLSVGLCEGLSRLAVRLGRFHRFGSDLAGIPMARLGCVTFADWGMTLLSFWLLSRSVGVELGGVAAGRTVFTGQFAGLISMIPGGLGSADAVWFKGFALMGVDHEPAAAAVVMFRAGFYLLPWLAALGVIYTALASWSAPLRRWQRRVVAGAVALNAALLLASAATPALRERFDVVEKVVPLGAIEVSHAAAAVSAALMLFLVRGLLRGYRSAFLATLTLLAASAVAHPLKGGDIEEAAASVVLMALLFGVRGAYMRRGRIPIGWELALSAAVGSVAFFLVVGLAAFEKVPYRAAMWAEFAERAQASRFLRAAVLVGVAGLVVLIRQATRPAQLWVTPTADEIDRAMAFARAHAESADALLVAGADKGVWFWEPKPGETAGMVLYQRRGDRAMVFKDPVLAAGADATGLLAAWMAWAEEQDLEVVFSMISPKWMEPLHDFGFHFLKVNEEAVVPLDGFTLAGGKNSGFRRTIREVEKAGFSYAWMEPPFDDALIDRLRVVSDAWLAEKGGRELQFSACCFSPAYLRRGLLGVAFDAGGVPVAFVSVQVTRPGGPATVDLMRYRSGVVESLMEYTLIKTIEHAASIGCASFSLGGAPLSDVGVWKSSRLVERGLREFSQRAERVYNYQGLLRFKNKFHPEWEARYLAYEQPWDWAGALIANARLVRAGSRADRARIAAARVGN